MKILIAGGAGYIGSVLIPKLIERGYEVSVIDLFWFGNHLPKEVGIVHKDIFDLKAEDVRGFDQVIFLAGLSNDPMAEFSPSKNFIFNAAAPAFLAYLAKGAGVKRFIYAGSCSVYGYTVNELYDETQPAVSNYPYGISKLQGEQGVMQLQDKGFSVIAFRQGTVSGYSPRMRLDLVVNTMFKSALANKTITVNNPAIWRPILSIQDAASAYIRAIEANEGISGIFNVASGNYTVGELGDLVQSGLKTHLKADVQLKINHVQDFRNYKVSIDKARRVLSFHPKHDVESIIKDLVDNLPKFKDFDNPAYYNIQVFRGLEKKD
ncbi:MAG: NAD(P)-dependent oxidoreductase [Acidobacteriota bacterium]|jgi:nucleoside-diphosphate-sugar epimerase|nr:NAD(P)-dependent oxidoreductase [Acidobacteriota bacterium]